jgi:hypothetical protein
MCLPIAVIAGATMAAGQLISGIQGMQAANYEGELARRNAALEVERARDSNERGRLEARSFYRDVGSIKGQQVASMAANGIDVGFGSAVRTQEDTQMLADEDASSLYRNIGERTRGFDINASNFRSEAAAARARGRSALVGGVIGAASSLMGGFQQQRAIRARTGLPSRGS